MNGMYCIDVEAVAEVVCDGCPMVNVKHFYDGYGLQEVSPPERECPIDFNPEMIVHEEYIACKLREAHKYLGV